MIRAAGPPDAWRRLMLPGALALIGLVLLLSLGTWQLARKSWKDALTTSLSQRLAAEPMALPSSERWPHLEASELEFRPVHLVAEFLNDKEGLVYTVGSTLRNDFRGPGYWVFTPARLAEGALVLVNRGFVPENRQDPASRREGALSGVVTLTGVLRWPDPPSMFTPGNDPARRRFFSRDPAAIAQAENLGAVAPFYIEQETPRPPGGLPSPAKLTVNLPNNHLQYALTWYALALGLLAIFTVFAVSPRSAASR